MSGGNWFSRLVSGIFESKQDRFAKGFPSSVATPSIWATFESSKYIIFDEAGVAPGGSGKEFLGEDNFGGEDVCNELISHLSEAFDCDKPWSNQWGYNFEFRVLGQDMPKQSYEILASFDPELKCWRLCVPLEVSKKVHDALQFMELTNIKWFEEKPDYASDLLTGSSAPF